MTGVDGFVDQGKVKAEAFSKRFKQENIIPQENPKVNEWLSNITADKKGYILTSSCYSLDLVEYQ